MQFFENLPQDDDTEDTEPVFEELAIKERLEATRTDLADLDQLYAMTSLALTTFPPPTKNKEPLPTLMASFAAIQLGVIINVSRQLDLILRKLYTEPELPVGDNEDGE